MGHSRPTHSAPVLINVRCYSDGDIIVRRGEATLRAKTGLWHYSKPRLFDHLIGSCQQRRRHGETKCLRGLEIDRQFVLDRCLHRQVGRLLAFEDAVDVARRSPILFGRIRPVGDQAAAGDEVAERGRRQANGAEPQA